jgi:hypothetical protein
MKKFEYMEMTARARDLTEDLNTLGKKGWQVVNLRWWDYMGSSLAGPESHWKILLMREYDGQG